MRHLRNAGLAVLVLAFSTSTAFAQRNVNTGAGAGGGFWEFGVDFAALVFGMDDPSYVSIGIGGGSVRAGRFISDAMSIEPRVNISTFSTNGSSFNDFGFEVGLLYHLQSDHAANQWYVRPLVTFNRSSSEFTIGTTTTSSSANQMGFGVGFGMKMPSKKNARFTWRAEATYQNMMKSGTIPASSQLSINGGVSVYTK